jgi:hypothetical protein
MKRFILTAVLLFGTAPTSYAFLDSFYKQSEVVQQARPDLLDVIDQQQDTKLNIQLHIGNDNTGYLAAKDMVVELHPNRVAPDYDRVVKLPGADGYFAHCSSGHRSLDLLNKANYINLDGTQHIDLQMGCWEVCWVKDKPAGTLGMNAVLDWKVVIFHNNSIRTQTSLLFPSFFSMCLPCD